MSSSPETEKIATPSRWRKLWPWLNVGLTAGLLIGGIWFLSRTIALADIRQALLVANGRYILLALGASALSGVLKAWRWRILLVPNSEEHIPFTAVFWAIWLGQFVNTIMPFLRVGEFGRVYALNKQTGFGKMQALSTVIVEKSLDLVLLGLMILILIPLAILPESVIQPGFILGGAALILLLGLGIVAYQTAVVIRLTRWIMSKFPPTVQKRSFPWLISGLEGLASLRSRDTVRHLIIFSIMIALIAITIPWLLFRAFAIDLGIVAALFVNAGITLISTPPTTPGELGIFEGAVFFMLEQLSFTNQAVIISYAVIYHLVILLPKIICGSIAVSRTKWTWQLQQTKAGFQQPGL